MKSSIIIWARINPLTQAPGRLWRRQRRLHLSPGIGGEGRVRVTVDERLSPLYDDDRTIAPIHANDVTRLDDIRCHARACYGRQSILS